MSESWSLKNLFDGLNREIEARLETSRRALAHPGDKGDASEGIWLDLLQRYLPARYNAVNAHVVDSRGTFSDQIDIVIRDKHYSPFIFNYEGKFVVPAESVYAVFEAKQTIDAGLIDYAQEKAASVRKLHRTSLPIPHAGGEYPPRPLPYIHAGILTFESEWSPALGTTLQDNLKTDDENSILDLGCIARHGSFTRTESGTYELVHGKPATEFLFDLIARLQKIATVPMIDVRAYTAFLT